MNTVSTYHIRLSYQRFPAGMEPVSLAKSWGSEISAMDKVEDMFGCVPFPYHVYVDTRDTQKGLEKRIKRMHTPERLYRDRQNRLRKKLMKTDPLFYDQMVDDLLKNDPYTLDSFKERQKERAEMNVKLAIHDEKVGKVWVNPKAKRLQSFDWPAMAKELQSIALKMDIYKAWDKILKEKGVVQ